MYFAQINEAGQCVAELQSDRVPEGAHMIEVDGPGYRGRVYADGVWSDPEPDPAYVPQRVSMRQARRALHQVGLLEMVDDLINSLDEPERTAARIDWDHAQEVDRQFGLVLQLAPALGLDDSELDDLFRLAGSIQ